MVGLKELRKAIEDVNHRHGPDHGKPVGREARAEESSEALTQVKTDNNYDNTETVTSMESMVPSSLLSNESHDNLMD